MKHYAKARRSQGPDRNGLAMYKLLLTCVLQHAPGGFPGLVALRDCYLQLQREYGIKQTDED
eukprot:10732361-Lingulodinium_polyedra.AAC.1